MEAIIYNMHYKNKKALSVNLIKTLDSQNNTKIFVKNMIKISAKYYLGLCQRAGDKLIAYIDFFGFTDVCRIRNFERLSFQNKNNGRNLVFTKAIHKRQGVWQKKISVPSLEINLMSKQKGSLKRDKKF